MKIADTPKKGGIWREGEVVVIDLQGRPQCWNYHARRIVEVLIRECRAWEWGSMDNILVDVRSMAEVLKEGKRTLWWHGDIRHGATWFHLTEYGLLGGRHDYSYVIHLDEEANRISLTPYRGGEDAC